MDLDRLLVWRSQRDAFFKKDPSSPIKPPLRSKFKGLSYYDPDPSLYFLVQLTLFDVQEDVEIQTTSGDTRWYRRYGEFAFVVAGERARLAVYQTPNGFFLPFMDATSGEETYPSGRYIDPLPQADGALMIDFNRAYNPFCAYNASWSCPLTPAENRLKVAIRAGEKTYTPPSE